MIPRGPHRFENHVENRFVYTGTHDHDTARGWYEGLDAPTRDAVRAVMRAEGVDEPEPWWQLVSLALRSPARVAIVQAQDILGLGSQARMNDPGPAARQLALAARARSADRRACPAAAGAHRGQRAYRFAARYAKLRSPRNRPLREVS